MKYAVIEDGIVTNVILADEDFAAQQGLVPAESAAIGWVYDGETFSPPSIPLSERKAAMREQVNDLRDRLELEPAPTTFGPIDMDATSSKRLLALVTAAQSALLTGATWNDTIVWTMADNTETPVTEPAIALQLSGAATAHGAALHGYAKTLKNAIEAAEDHDALDAIDIAAGWP